jgi:hypothetical protein
MDHTTIVSDFVIDLDGGLLLKERAARWDPEPAR